MNKDRKEVDKTHPWERLPRRGAVTFQSERRQVAWSGDRVIHEEAGQHAQLRLVPGLPAEVGVHTRVAPSCERDTRDCTPEAVRVGASFLLHQELSEL